MKSPRVRCASTAGAAFMLALGAATWGGTEPCPGNANGDAVVNVNDLLVVVSSFGDCAEGTTCSGDLNGDGVVTVDDLLLVVQNFGPCPGTPACVGNASCDDGDPCTIDVCVNGICNHIPSHNPGCGG